MNSVIVLAMPADHDRVRNIVGSLAEADLDIFWNRAVPGSAEWPQAVEAVMAAPAALFFWSAATTEENAAPFRTLARRAVGAGKALCIRLDRTALPDGLSGCTVYDLRGWRARASSLFMLDIVAAVRAKAAGLDPPLPRAPRHLLIRRTAIALPSAVAALALLIGLYRDLGIDARPSAAERRAWGALRPGSCDDLRMFLNRYRQGAHASEAETLLASRRVRQATRLQTRTRPLPVFIAASTAAPAPNEAGARRVALDRGRAEAEANCSGLAATAEARLRDVRLEPGELDCERFAKGYSCALDGQALCRLDESEPIELETCGS